jgi:cell division septation protein DedD
MLLYQCIQELLYQHECVTVPNFGAFLTRSHQASVSANGAFLPPRKDILFNRLLATNDGILAHYYAQKEGIGYENALRKIEKEVSLWKKRIQTQVLRFPGVGEMQLSADKKMVFIPLGKINFDTHSFGLKSFHRNPLQTQSSSETPKIISIMENTTNDDLMFQPEGNSENKSKAPWMRYAAVGVVAVALMAGAYYFGEQYTTSERLKQQELAQEKIIKNVQEATFDLGTLESVSVQASANASTSESEGPVDTNQKYYSIIAGSFRSLENANRKVADLKAEGYEAALAKTSPQGLYRVAYGRLTSKRKALNLLSFVKYTQEEEAWYLEE